MRPRSALHHYQDAAVEFGRKNEKCAIWAEMGLGKTPITLTLLRDLFDDFEIYRVLIVAPLRVIRTSWPNEIAAWEHTHGMSYTVIDGQQNQKKKLACSDTMIHLISRDSLKWLVEFWRGALPYDVLVLDEASSFRSQSSQRWRAALVASTRVKRIIELTGTPTPNGLHQAWAQIHLLDHGARLGHTYTSFKDRWLDYNPFTQKLTAKPHAEKVIHERLRDICFTLKAEDYLDLPARIDRNVMTELTPEQQAQYEKLERDAVLEMDAGEITAFSAGALAAKCLQFSSGAVYDADKNYTVFHDAKIEALRDIIDEANGEPVLVAYNYKSDLARLKKAFPGGMQIDTDESITLWNEGKLDIAFAHPQSAGLGLNLQAGGRVIVWFALTWNLELKQQFDARLHRQGQTKPVIIHHLVCAGTIDEDVMQALPAKAAVQNRLMDAMKRRIERVLHK
ncbi:MAG: DEAD/DEAH box helicase [Pseudomonadota bacterium]